MLFNVIGYMIFFYTILQEVILFYVLFIDVNLGHPEPRHIHYGGCVHHEPPLYELSHAGD